jgi:hypothetical protein
MFCFRRKWTFRGRRLVCSPTMEMPMAMRRQFSAQQKLDILRRRRKENSERIRTEQGLTLTQRSCTTRLAGETEGSSAGKQLPRDLSACRHAQADGRPGRRGEVAAGAAHQGRPSAFLRAVSLSNHSRPHHYVSATPQMLEENPGSPVCVQRTGRPESSHPLTPEPHLSISR